MYVCMYVYIYIYTHTVEVLWCPKTSPSNGNAAFSATGGTETCMDLCDLVLACGANHRDGKLKTIGFLSPESSAGAWEPYTIQGVLEEGRIREVGRRDQRRKDTRVRFMRDLLQANPEVHLLPGMTAKWQTQR